jgi:spore maturation protein CgeB
MPHTWKITILGLSITSSWGNGHATTYRSLLRALAERGHDLLFLERDRPWYAANRDLAAFPVPVRLYESVEQLQGEYLDAIRESDLVIVGSYVPDGVAVGKWVTARAGGLTAFYDIDTPVTLGKLARRDFEYLTPELIGRYDLYLSFTGGPTLTRLEKEFHSPMARPLYCSVDPSQYFSEPAEPAFDLGYLGTYSDDRQPVLDKLMLQAAARWRRGRFVVGGPQYPDQITWPANVERIEHIPPAKHRDFYNRQRFTLNVTRAEMVQAGFSPSVRLFEAAACGTPVISDWWAGLNQFFVPDREILISRSADETLHALQKTSEAERREIGRRAQQRILNEHTAPRRAETLEHYVREAQTPRRGSSTGTTHRGKGLPVMFNSKRES